MVCSHISSFSLSSLVCATPHTVTSFWVQLYELHHLVRDHLQSTSDLFPLLIHDHLLRQRKLYMNLRNISELPQFCVCLLQIMQQAFIQNSWYGLLSVFQSHPGWCGKASFKRGGGCGYLNALILQLRRGAE